MSKQSEAVSPVDKILLEDETILALLPGYLGRRRLEIYKLQRLLSQKDFDSIRSIGHNLKGSGGLYGIPRVSEFGDLIEKSALLGDESELQLLVDALGVYLENLVIPTI